MATLGNDPIITKTFSFETKQICAKFGKEKLIFTKKIKTMYPRAFNHTMTWHKLIIIPCQSEQLPTSAANDQMESNIPSPA